MSGIIRSVVVIAVVAVVTGLIIQRVRSDDDAAA